MTATITPAGNVGAGDRAMPMWRSWPVLVAAGATVLALGAWGITGASGGDGPGSDGPIYVAERGSMTIHVTESGTIQAREQVVLKCEVEGQTTIIWLVEEGKYVEKGDLLVELDASERQDELLEQQIRVKNADAAYIRARESLEITRSQGESDVAQAELDYEFAIQDLKKYVEGEYPKELDEMESRIKLAEGDLEDAENTAEWSQKLFKEKYIAQTDLTSDKLKLDRAKLDLKTAKANLELLVDYTYDRTVRELESNVDQTRMALDRVKRQALANVVQEEAELSAKVLELKRQSERLTKDEDQLSKTKIYSPASGMVIYATTGQSDRRGNDEPLEAGRAVREREELIHLPTADSMLVNIKIHESSLKKVQVGQRVDISINALPGKTYTGKIARIAPLPDAQSFWRGNPDLKVYNTEIHLDGELEGVRTGMTCKAQVIVQKLEDVISIPVQSVIKVGGQDIVYVKRGSRVKPVQVELGLDNKDRIHIISGLSEGDRVLTNPPLEDTDLQRSQKEEANADTSTDAKPADKAPAGPTGSTPTGAERETKPPGPQADPPKDTRPGDRGPEQDEQRRGRLNSMTPAQREARRNQRGGQHGDNAGAQDQQK